MAFHQRSRPWRRQAHFARARQRSRKSSARHLVGQRRTNRFSWSSSFAIAGAVVTIPTPESGGQCLPVFSTPLRAADYVRTQLSHEPAVTYLRSTPTELATMLSDIRESGIESVAIDRCPRCDVFWMTNTSSIRTAHDVLTLWSIAKSTEQARADICVDYAVNTAAAGDVRMARDVALEAIGHVSPEDPRLHFLLGQIAIATSDAELLLEVRAHLRFLNLASWEERLDRIAASGQVDFQPMA